MPPKYNCLSIEFLLPVFLTWDIYWSTLQYELFPKWHSKNTIYATFTIRCYRQGPLWYTETSSGLWFRKLQSSLSFDTYQLPDREIDWTAVFLSMWYQQQSKRYTQNSLKQYEVLQNGRHYYSVSWLNKI